MVMIEKNATQGGKEMRIEKKVLNDALRILGKMVCQTSPAEVFRGVRFVGTPGDVLAMATDGEEQVSLRNMYEDFNVRSELLKSRQFYSNAFQTAVNYEDLMRLKKELMKP